MCADAMAILIGVAVGVGASIPASLLLVAVLRRDQLFLSSEKGLSRNLRD